MYSKGRLLVSTFVLAVSTCALAVGNGLDVLKQKAQTDKADAYQYALQIRPQMEADPEFDYLYGVLALSQKHYSEAQFALERVVVAQPANMHARLALAKAYQAIGDTGSARKQFEVVKRSNPPGYVMRDINVHLGQLSEVGENKGSLNSYVEVMAGHDSNANAATDSSTVNLGGFFGVTPLDTNSRKQSSKFFETTVGTSYYVPLSENNGLELRGRVSDRNNMSAHQFDHNSYRGSAGLTHKQGDDFYRGTVTVQNSRTSDSDFQEYYSLSGDWLRQSSRGISYFAGFFLNRLSYPDDKVLDVDQLIGHFGVQKQAGDFAHTVGVMLGDERARHDNGEHNARIFQSVYYDARYDVNYKHQLHARFYVQDAAYQDNEPQFPGARDEISQQVTLGWTAQLTKPLSWKTETSYYRNDSDVSYYVYDRSYIKTGFRYAF